MNPFVARMMRRTASGLFVLLVACWSAAADKALPLSPPCPVEELRSCSFHEFVPPKIQTWKHRHNRLVARSGAPIHSAQDLLVPDDGSPITIEGKFTYGRSSKDLEDEPVLGFLDTAEGWIPLGEKQTNDDGRVRFTVATPLSAGEYKARLVVRGDASAAEAKLWVLPRGTHLAIFDIDGTLTLSDKEILKAVKADFFSPLVHKPHVPVAYSGATQLTKAQAARGYVNVYLTGRPYLLASTTRRWLEGPLGFAPGVLHVTDSIKEAVPNQKGVGNFKLNFLKELVAEGFLLDVAYGNARTDIRAYHDAGLLPGTVWIIGPHGTANGIHKVNGSWDEIAREVSALPPISQPWQEMPALP